jgi:hypothetical protein
VQVDFNHTIDSNDNDGDDGGFGKEMEESIERTLINLEENPGAILPNASKSLEICYVGLRFQLKKLEFMDSMNQELKCGKKIMKA